jgi:hypothetical protein
MFEYKDEYDPDSRFVFDFPDFQAYLEPGTKQSDADILNQLALSYQARNNTGDVSALGDSFCLPMNNTMQ